jgi:ATP-dependent Clp protease ATP-binding subunit ClpA
MAHTAEPVPTPRYRQIVAAASSIASEQGHQYVGVEHLFLAILGDRAAVPTQVLSRLVDPNRAEAELRAVMESDSYKTSSRTRISPPGELGMPYADDRTLLQHRLLSSSWFRRR